MRKQVHSGVVLVVVLALASAAFAGDYHSGTTLVCSDCHVMHFSQSHAYDDGTDPALGTGPNEYLLRDEASSLCKTCHDAYDGAPDVVGDNFNDTYERQAGALNEVGGVDSYLETDGHTLGYSGAVPGNTAVIDPASPLTCTNCHQAHGSGAISSYRNLGSFGTGVGTTLSQVSFTSADVEVNPLNVWVFQDVSTSIPGNPAGNTFGDHYGMDRITFNEPVVDDGLSYGDFCAGCHGDFHGDPGSANIGGAAGVGDFERHPVAGVDIGEVGGGHSNLGVFTGQTNHVQVMSPTGQRANDATNGYDGTDTGLTPSCMSCHKGHGNMNNFGLIYIGAATPGAITEEGDGGAYRDMCKQCHVQGG